MLWLNFKDENGEEQRIELDRDTFTVGRHSACDLTYPDSRLSREHLRLDRDDGNYYVLDLGSSNGTTLNGKEAGSSMQLNDGDVLDLGGGLDIRIEIEKPESTAPSPSEPEFAQPSVPTPQAAAATPAFSTPQPASDGIPTAFFILAPLLGIVVLGIIIGAVVLFGSGEKEVVNGDDDIGNYSVDDEPDKPTDDEDTRPTPAKTSSPPIGNLPVNSGTPVSSPGPGGGIERLPSGGDSSETAKIEQNGAAFLRQIAQNDPRAFLTGEQATKVNAKVKQLGKSSLADNFSSARKNASAIRSLAASKNLKPQFLAVAAITKLGSSRGDVLQAAQSIADVYDKLGIQIGNENFDDALLMVAAYDQGVAGDTMKMRNMLQAIAETPGSPGTREIRSIWYLQKTGKITAAEYERALGFLAIGTIAQNPKDFGVNTEALRL